MNKLTKCSIPLLATTLMLGGCGTMPGDRAVSGAGIGAGTGAVVGAVLGAPVAGAALLGAAAGGLTGALTSRNQVDFGQPAWRQNAYRTDPPTRTPTVANTTVRGIQSELTRRGFYRGPIDGIDGTGTRAAIRSYQQRNGLLVDGYASPALLAHMRDNPQG